MALSLLKSTYETSSTEGSDGEPSFINNNNSSIPMLNLIVQPNAPVISTNIDSSRPVDPATKVLLYNPKYDDLYAPTVGPDNPFQSHLAKASKNMLTGFVEKSNFSDMQFENQRRTFKSYGYAMNPSVTGEEAVGEMVGDLEKAALHKGVTVFEKMKKRPGDKRKRVKNDDAADIDGYLGPWGKYVDEETVSRPKEEDKKFLDEYLIKMSKKSKRNRNKAPEQMENEASVLHLDTPLDYQGRSFLSEPKSVGVNLRSTEPPAKCFMPKKLMHTWEGHTKAITAIRWFPITAHLLLSSSMDHKVKLWEVYNERRCVRSYMGHRESVRDVSFNNAGDQFLSTSLDRYIKMWDTETGQCINRFSNGKEAYCIKFHPDHNKQHLFVAGTRDKKIVCWDTRSNEIVQEYDRHLGAVNTITFVDQNRRFVSTSDDKSLRVWDWDVPVDFKYVADPSMHSMPYVTTSPTGKWLACQSMDNQILIFNAINGVKMVRKKVFKGHMVAGFSCGIDFSPDMSYLISGDGDGMLYVWDWKTTKMYNKFKVHDGACSSVLWHPHETSKVVSCGWDGLIKLWD